MHIVKTDVQKHASIHATPDCVQLQVHIFIRVQFIVQFMVPGVAVQFIPVYLSARIILARIFYPAGYYALVRFILPWYILSYHRISYPRIIYPTRFYNIIYIKYVYEIHCKNYIFLTISK